MEMTLANIINLVLTGGAGALVLYLLLYPSVVAQVSTLVGGVPGLALALIVTLAVALALKQAGNPVTGGGRPSVPTPPSGLNICLSRHDQYTDYYPVSGAYELCCSKEYRTLLNFKIASHNFSLANVPTGEIAELQHDYCKIAAVTVGAGSGGTGSAGNVLTNCDWGDDGKIHCPDGTIVDP